MISFAVFLLLSSLAATGAQQPSDNGTDEWFALRHVRGQHEVDCRARLAEDEAAFRNCKPQMEGDKRCSIFERKWRQKLHVCLMREPLATSEADDWDAVWEGIVTQPTAIVYFDATWSLLSRRGHFVVESLAAGLNELLIEQGIPATPVYVLEYSGWEPSNPAVTDWWTTNHRAPYTRDWQAGGQDASHWGPPHRATVVLLRNGVMAADFLNVARYYDGRRDSMEELLRLTALSLHGEALAPVFEAGEGAAVKAHSPRGLATIVGSKDAASAARNAAEQLSAALDAKLAEVRRSAAAFNGGSAVGDGKTGAKEREEAARRAQAAAKAAELRRSLSAHDGDEL